MELLNFLESGFFPEMLAFIMAFLQPPYLMTFPKIALIYKAYRYAACLWILCFNMKQFDVKRVFWYVGIFMFYLVLSLSTVLSGHYSLAIPEIKNLAFSLCFIRIVDFYSGRSLIKTVSTLRIAFEALFWINLVTVLLRPAGLYTVVNDVNTTDFSRGFFLGHENNAIEYIIPVISLSMVESYIRKGKLDLHVLILIICSFYMVLFTWSANAIICVAIFALFYFVFEMPFARFFRCAYFLMASAGATLVLAVFHLQEKFAWFITTVLKKNMTLSKRTFIWEASVRWIMSRPLIGYGVETAEEKYAKIQAVNSCHNYYLDMLYYGGIVLLFIFIVLIAGYVLSVCDISDNKLRQIAATQLGVYSILWIATPVHRYTIFMMFCVWVLLSRLPELNPLTDLNDMKSLSILIRHGNQKADTASRSI